ncbi:MAG: phosphodiesterase [Caulobacteraceae bacterium]|jgi:chromate reductase|nr:phosphodiesterase [Caulobacteraceae bacterium]
MPSDLNVAVLVGSLRKASFSRRLAEALLKLAPEGMTGELVAIGTLPLYNQDFDDEGAPPPAWVSFRDTVRPKDAVLFVTPEYNRSVPGVLKNALDVGSRPYGKSVWNAKPAAVVSASPGAIGGFGANHHLRQSLVFLNMPVLQQPEAYVGQVADLVADDGSVTRENTREFLRGLMAAFDRWARLTRQLPG